MEQLKEGFQAIQGVVFDLRIKHALKTRIQTLLNHIEVHRYYLGIDWQRDIAWEEAVTHWYDEVYLPVVQVIRELGILRRFPGRTETDLYLWVAEHRAQLEEMLGGPIHPVSAVSSLALEQGERYDSLIARLGGRLLDLIVPEKLASGPPPGQWRSHVLLGHNHERLFADLLVPVNGKEDGWCALEQSFVVAKREISNLNQVILRNPDDLYKGHYTVKEEINRNIDEYLRQNSWLRLGVEIRILVKTKKDRILYPSTKDEEFGITKDPSSINYMEIASENFQVLNEGLAASVDLNIRHNSWLSNLILLFYVSLSVWILTRAVQARFREVEKEDAARNETVERLSARLTGTDRKLRELESREAEYRRKIEELQREKQGLSRDVDGLLEEIERQEQGLGSQKELRENLESELIRLRKELDRVKDRTSPLKSRRRSGEATQKRFRVLYKNLEFTDRAIEGFLSLPEDHQLKAEELIHKLDGNGSQVTVRRKVFAKGGKTDVLEADFSYSGRLYFQKDHRRNRIRIVAVGTKNTQDRDLAYVETAG